MLLTAAGHGAGSGTGFSSPDQRQSGSQQADIPQVCHCLPHVNKILTAKTRSHGAAQDCTYLTLGEDMRCLHG